MYNNIENIVYRMFQNYYDISVNVMSTNVENDISQAIPAIARDISSVARPTYVSILMGRILDSSNNNTYQDTSYVAYRFTPTYYAPTYYAPTYYAPISNNTNANTNTVYNSSFYRQNNAFIDLLRTLSQNYTSEENSSLENFINSTFENNKEKFKKVISDYELEKLKPHIFIKKNETTTNCQCPIYCYNFEENEEVIKLPCNHNFNCEGIIKWLTQESNTCPVCRYEFDYKEINSDNKRQTTSENSNEYNENNEENEYNENNEYNEDYNNEDDEYNINNQEDYYEDFMQSNNISEDELFLQEILLYAYSNTNTTS
jgi:hypothetical protein